MDVIESSVDDCDESGSVVVVAVVIGVVVI